MRLGITGDTHGDMQAVRRLLAAAPPVDKWLHTGDYASDANLLQRLTGLPVLRVLGNCDGAPSEDAPANVDEIFVEEGWRLWLTHGHRYMGHTRIQELPWWAKQLEVDIVIFGHTHVPLCEYYGDTLLLNPGSPARPRGGSRPSFAVLTLQQGQKPQVEFFELPLPERGFAF